MGPTKQSVCCFVTPVFGLSLEKSTYQSELISKFVKIELDDNELMPRHQSVDKTYICQKNQSKRDDSSKPFDTETRFMACWESLQA